MRKSGKRIELLYENFIRWHEEGMSIIEIAEKCNLSRFYVYAHLGEIERLNGVSRESLLKKPQGKSRKRRIELEKRVKSEEVLQNGQTLLTELGTAIEEIDSVMVNIDNLTEETK